MRLPGHGCQVGLVRRKKETADGRSSKQQKGRQRDEESTHLWAWRERWSGSQDPACGWEGSWGGGSSHHTSES